MSSPSLASGGVSPTVNEIADQHLDPLRPLLAGGQHFGRHHGISLKLLAAVSLQERAPGLPQVLAAVGRDWEGDDVPAVCQHSAIACRAETGTLAEERAEERGDERRVHGAGVGGGGVEGQASPKSAAQPHLAPPPHPTPRLQESHPPEALPELEPPWKPPETPRKHGRHGQILPRGTGARRRGSRRHSRSRSPDPQFRAAATQQPRQERRH